MKSGEIFLTTDEVLGAVCRDLQHYEPQVPLMCEILRLISEDKAGVIRKNNEPCVWVRRKGRRGLVKLDAEELPAYTCDQLAGTTIDLDTWVAICRRVFQARIQKIRDPTDGQWGLSIDTGMEGFACRQCGHCCRRLNYRNELTAEDIRRWKAMGRNDILAWVAEIRTSSRERTYQIWVVPGTNRFAETCPFLKQGPSNHIWICSIHDMKPQICRQYPLTRKHAVQTGCKGFLAGSTGQGNRT